MKTTTIVKHTIVAVSMAGVALVATVSLFAPRPRKLPSRWLFHREPVMTALPSWQLEELPGIPAYPRDQKPVDQQRAILMPTGREVVDSMVMTSQRPPVVPTSGRPTAPT